MRSHSEETLAEVIETFISTLLYLDDVLSIDKYFFDNMATPIYPSEHSVKWCQCLRYRGLFSVLHLSTSDGFVKTELYDKQDEFDFDILNFPLLDGDVLVRYIMLFIIQ